MPDDVKGFNGCSKGILFWGYELTEFYAHQTKIDEWSSRLLCDYDKAIEKLLMEQSR